MVQTCQQLLTDLNLSEVDQTVMELFKLVETYLNFIIQGAHN